jgi:nucleotide-binding universal stress UspA family protein
MFRFQHILVPLDGSELAERALQPALAIAKAMSARLVLFRVVPQLTLLAADPQLYEEMGRMSAEETETYLRAVRAALPPTDVRVETVSELGAPADAIVNYVAAHGVDLIVMSSHGHTGVRRWIHGSVAERVLHEAPCATIIICAANTVDFLQYKRLMVPLDGSALAEQALAPASALAEALCTELYLLRVTSPAHVPLETMAMQQVFNEIEHQERNEAERYLQQQYQKLPNKHLFFDVLVARRSVADTIIDYVQSRQIDLIVMSTHGRTGLDRVMFGSVTEKVLRGACCATLVIRRPASD